MGKGNFLCCFDCKGVKVMAERQGFEPWIPCGIHAFQACAFSHSAISPNPNNYPTLTHSRLWIAAANGIAGSTLN